MDYPKEVGDWIQISVLGSGAFGTVMLWHNRRSSDFIAIKKCKFQKADALTKKQRERWHMEVDFLKSIDHKNIIGFKTLDPILEELIYKYNPSKLPLLSMEYCKKGNLRRYLNSDPIKLCGLPERDVRYILEDISNGLDYLHSKKITHRDIKPDNIVLQHCDNRKGETLYKIIDLGYAKEIQDATLSFVGTLHYLAPEIFYNQDYGHSVDYWSMGTMVFEIICGVLPFLPELTPFERYEKIKDKGAEDICIYMSYSGSIANSAEIKREHFVTSCFKENMEMWLKRVLQMDPLKRTFSSDLSAFDYLRFILDKRIIQVFSVYKQEFYSYEISDSTLLGTLKGWISRDIKIPKSNLLFLFCGPKNHEGKNKILHCIDDNTLLEYLVQDTAEFMVYVYKKDTVFCEKYLDMPKLVKQLFKVNSEFQLKFARQVYRQALFYVFSELRLVSELKKAFLSLVTHIEDLREKVRNKYVTATTEYSLILSKINEFSTKKKHNISSQELSQCFRNFGTLLSTVEIRKTNLQDFGRQYNILRNMKEGVDSARQDIGNILDACDIQSRFNRINGKGFLEKQNGETQDVILKRIKDVVSETLKCKYKLMNDKTLKGFSQDLCLLLKHSEKLLVWSDDFIKNIQKLYADFSKTEQNYDKILSESNAVIPQRYDFISSVNREDTRTIIDENKLLRCKLADLLSEKMAAHKDFVDESLKYLDINFTQ